MMLQAKTVTIDTANIGEVLPLTIMLDEIGAPPLIWELARVGALTAGEI